MDLSRWLYRFQRHLRQRPISSKVAADKSPQGRLGQEIERLEDRIVPQASSFDQAYVTQLYTALLDRAVDSAGLTFWSNQIASGESLDQVALGIESSTEYKSDLVNQMYETYLGRPVDAGSLGFWVGQLSSESEESVAASIIGSQEFFNDAGGTNSGFLSALYLDVLGRPIDPTGAAGYGAMLASGASRTSVAYSVLTSNEYRTDLVEQLYQDHLYRTADPAGLAFWVGQLDQGASDQSVLAGILSSSEFTSETPWTPIVTSPSATLTTADTTFVIAGFAPKGSLVQVLSDGAVVGSEQLAGSQTFAITVPLTSGANTFDVTATNPFGTTSLPAVTPTITSTSTSDTVTVTAPADQTSTEGTTILPVSVVAIDADGYSLSYSATGLPSGLTIDSLDGIISGTPAAGDSASSPYTVTVSATAATSGATDSATFTWSVTSPVTVTNPGSQSDTEGEVVSLPITATDSISGATLTYSATDLPSGLTIDSADGVISGTVATGDAASSPYSVTVSATDGTYSGSTSFTWTITSAVSVTNPGNQSDYEGESVNLSITATDSISGATLTFSTTDLPSGLTIDTADGVITGTVASGDAASSPYSVTVTATDGTYSGSTTFTWTVTSPVSITSPGNQSDYEGESVSLSVPATDANSLSLSYSETGLPSGLTIDSANGVISGTVATGDAATSPYTVTVTASDGTYTPSSTTFTWTVTSPVSITSPGAQSDYEGEAVGLAISASDANSLSLSYSETGLPSGLTIDSANGVISGTVATGDAATSPYTVTVTASDGTYTPSSTTFTWTVTSPVSITSPGNQSDYEGESVSLSVPATDANSLSLSYSETGLPSGLTIDSANGVISGTVATGDAATSPYTVTVTASDGTYTPSSTTFTWTVTSPVSITSPGNQSDYEGEAVDLAISASDANSLSLSYSETGLPSGLTIDSANGVISGTVATGDATTSPYTVTVTASDGTYTPSSTTFSWTVTSPVNIASPGDQSVYVGEGISLSIGASDSNGLTLTYSATNLPSGLTIASSTGLISGTIAAGDASGSPYSVTVTATDNTYTPNSISFTLTVSTVAITNPGNQTDTEGDFVDLPISATDSTAGAVLTYSATDLPSGLTIASASGIISGTVAIGDSSSSPYSVTVTATDNTYSASTTFTWTVTSIVTVTNPGDQTDLENDGVTLTITGSDTTGGTLTYSATGLPTGLQLLSTGALGGVIASGDSTSSPYTVTITATDGTYSGSTTFTWTVGPPAMSVTAVPEQENYDGDILVAGVTVSASDGTTNSLSYSATGLPSGLSINASTGVISGTIASTADTSSPYTAVVTVTDPTTGASGVTDITWLVYNTADPLLAPPATQLNVDGDTVTGVTVTATAANASSVTYSATGLPSGLSINSSTGVISGTLAPYNSASDSTSPDVDSPYAVTVTATEGAASSSATFTWVVTQDASISALPVSLTDPAWVTLPSGVRYLDLVTGTGAVAAEGDTITVAYAGYLTDGTLFNAGGGFTTPLIAATPTASGLIQGWVDGMAGMAVGGVRLLDIPSSLAYKTSSNGNIPANAELVFEIVLTSVS